MTPRGYQLPVFQAAERGIKRFWLCWHRRAGKDEVCMHNTALRAMLEPGTYWHCLPEYAQARKAIWDAVNPKTGKRRIDEVFPPEIRKRTREDEMFFEFKNGSTWQLVGSDRYDSLVGAGPRGIVFSEYALSDPMAWDYFRPMLLESNGWAMFNSTVRGRNHFWKLGDFARNDSGWFHSNLPADQTGVFTPEQLEAERRELCATRGDEEGEARFRQEYFNDPDVAMPGAYFAHQLRQMELEGRIGTVHYDPRYPVGVALDLGYGDLTTVWFWQFVDGWVNVIDYYQGNRQLVDHYAKVMREKPYSYEDMVLPHDAGHGHLAGEPVADQFRKQGFPRQTILDPIPVDDFRIRTIRSFLHKCRFDAARCEKGLSALRSYHHEWDEKIQDWKGKPKHDWSSHATDAFLHMAIGFRLPAEERVGNYHRYPQQAAGGDPSFG